MSREWFSAAPALRVEHRPRLLGRRRDLGRVRQQAPARPASRRSRPATSKGQPRKMAVIAPNNPEYQQCVRLASRSCWPSGQRRSTSGSTTPSTSPRLQTQAANLLAAAQVRGHHVGVLLLRPVHAAVPDRAGRRRRTTTPSGSSPASASSTSTSSARSSPTGRATSGPGPSAAARRRPARVAADEPGLPGLQVGARRRARPSWSTVLYYQLSPLALGIQMAGPEPHARDLRDRAVRLPADAPGRPAGGTSAPSTTRPSSTSGRSGGTPMRCPRSTASPGTWVDDGTRYQRRRTPAGRPGGVPVKRSYVLVGGLVAALLAGDPDRPGRRAPRHRRQGALFGSAPACWPSASSSPTAPPGSSTSPTAPWAALGAGRGRRPRRRQGRGPGRWRRSSASPPAWRSGRSSSGSSSAASPLAAPRADRGHHRPGPGCSAASRIFLPDWLGAARGHPAVPTRR